MHDKRAFALKPEYAEGFSGATIAYGPDHLTIDLKVALEANDGVVVTDDGHLASALARHDAFEAAAIPDSPTLAAIPELGEVKTVAEVAAELAPAPSQLPPQPAAAEPPPQPPPGEPAETAAEGDQAEQPAGEAESAPSPPGDETTDQAGPARARGRERS